VFWALDPALAMLNHGSFGACPLPVLQLQQRLRSELERRPVEFLTRHMTPLLDESRESLARLIGADPSDLVFVPNVTAAVNSVLRSRRFRPGDELLVTDHDYNACRNVARYVAQREGLRVVVVRIPAPIESPAQIVDAVLRSVTDRTGLAVLDHVSSPTAVLFPIAELVKRLAALGIDTLVDGAHAPGMVPLDIAGFGAAYYGGNCHKWLCAPKAAGFLHVRRDRQEGLQPCIISHGYNTPRPGRSPFHDAFDWPGTLDPTPWLCVGEAIRFLGTLFPGGIDGLMRRNHKLAVWARRLLCGRLGLSAVCPEEMLGSMAALGLPDDLGPDFLDEPTALPGTGHRLNLVLRDRFGIELPLYYWPAPPKKLLRISVQAYNQPQQFEALAAALEAILP
jgi:isopenicillin-N epimerase